MIEIKTLLGIIGAFIAVSGSIGAFFIMQTRQNMKIQQLEVDLKKLKEHTKEEVDDIKRKQSLATSHQIETEKAIIEINTKLDHMIQTIEELKVSIDRRT